MGYCFFSSPFIFSPWPSAIFFPDLTKDATRSSHLKRFPSPILQNLSHPAFPMLGLKCTGLRRSNGRLYGLAWISPGSDPVTWIFQPHFLIALGKLPFYNWMHWAHNTLYGYTKIWFYTTKTQSSRRVFYIIDSFLCALRVLCGFKDSWSGVWNFGNEKRLPI